MATTVQPQQIAEADVQAIVAAQRRLLTFDEFDRMKEADIIAEGERVELLDGVMLTMSTVGGRHTGCIIRCDRHLQRTIDPTLLVSVQNPIRLEGATEFVPDLIVYRGDENSNEIPDVTQVLLVIEIGASSRNYDRTVKALRYAAAGIPEMILVDLVDDQLISYADPREGKYQQNTVAGRGQLLPSASLPGLTFDVDRILGPQNS